MAVLTPPLRGNDERDHFTRVSAISAGRLFMTTDGERVGAPLPDGFTDQLDDLAGDVFVESDTTAFLERLGTRPPDGSPVFVSGGVTGSYPPGAYLPHIATTVIGQRVGAPLLVQLYAARVAGAVTYAAILGLAVSRMPVHRWVLAAGGLAPIALNQAGTVSADPVTAAASFLLVAVALRLAVDTGAPVRRLVIEAAGASLVLALGKPPYLVFVLLLVVPAIRWWCRLAAPLTAVVAGSVALAGAWLRYQDANSMRLDTPGLTLLSEVPGYYAYRGIDAPAQTHDVLTRPWEFVGVLRETFAHEGWNLPINVLGELGSYHVPGLLLLGFLVVLLVSAGVADVPGLLRLGTIERVALLSTSTVVAVGVCAIVYTRVNEYGAPRIDQLTPRYFAPLVPLVLIGLLPAPRRPTTRSVALGAVVASGLVVVLVLVAKGARTFYYA